MRTIKGSKIENIIENIENSLNQTVNRVLRSDSRRNCIQKFS